MNPHRVYKHSFRRKLKLFDKIKVPIDEDDGVSSADRRKDITFIAASSSSADACRQKNEETKGN
jgi:hypothetical protein